MDELLEASYFEPHVGQLVRFKGTDFAFPLVQVIKSEQSLPDYVKRQPFTLIFRGPKPGRVMPEGSYECEFEDGAVYSIHISPIHTPQPDRQEYQAVFN